MSARDPRLLSYRWRKRVRPAVLARDRYRCQVVEGCTATGDRVDHITPAYPGMSDAQFYDMRNLRAACNQHNLARYWVGLMEPGTTPPVRVHGDEVAPHAMVHASRSAYGQRPVSLAGHASQRAPSPNLYTQNTIFGDYTRKPSNRGAA